uniref:Universal stress protein family protein n=1 Tax=Zea mays TaxID=4577 RepID=B6TTX5_MAIZE|nr:universal stress protein family protein [Zea mays]|eukprot:NP_001150820.1 universal stress protein family protein [Zea mays]
MGSSGGSSEHFLRQLSSSDGGSAPHHLLQREWECGGVTGSGSRRGSRKKTGARGHRRRGGGFCRAEEAAPGRKRVMVVVDQSSGAKHAMLWALTHVANKGDFLTLLHVLPPESGHSSRGAAEDASALANSLGALCKACKPEVEVEAPVIQGPKLPTILSQVKKLEASVLVLSQRSPSPFCCFPRSSSEELVEECIDRAECLTLAVRRQSKGVGGYLVSTRWQKNFWLLA